MTRVTIIIPCRNEEAFFEKCLRSIIENDYPKDTLEVFVVDGASEDGTPNIIQKYTKKYPFIRYLKNERKIIPAAMNVGIKNAQGEIIMKMDAHSTYQKDYISKCVHYLIEYNADNVGGILITRPRGNTLQARAIAAALSHPFGAGSSPFRKASASKNPREVDTVAFGCYKKNVFDRIGLYNENLTRSSDMELNIRLKKSGGKILLIPSIIGYYYPEATFKAYAKHNIQDGIWAIYPLKFTHSLLRPRHLVPLLFIMALIVSLILSFFLRLFFYVVLAIASAYIITSFAVSFLIAVNKKDYRYFFAMPVAFAIRHIVYGIGSLWGILKLL